MQAMERFYAKSKIPVDMENSPVQNVIFANLS